MLWLCCMEIFLIVFVMLLIVIFRKFLVSVLGVLCWLVVVWILLVSVVNFVIMLLWLSGWFVCGLNMCGK